jgi:hypothetical protein
MTDSSGDKKPKLVDVGLGLAILLVLVALVIGASFLGNPYHAIAEVGLYALFVAVVAVRLRSCLRLAKDSVYSAKLKKVAVYLVFAVFMAIEQLVSIIGTEDSSYSRLCASLGAYLALCYLLEVVESLLKQAVAKPPTGHAPGSLTEAAGSSAPNPSLQQKGPA